jgi:hypothetical protein
MKRTLTFEFRDLPKISLNQFYAGTHWSKRNKIKDNYHLLISSMTKEKIDFPCEVEYKFWFKSRPLDCSNACGGMIKLIEDCLFLDDSYKMVRSIKVTSEKRKDDIVFIKVIEI